MVTRQETSANYRRNKTIVDATIAELQDALTTGTLSSVELVAKHLHRIAQYDRRGPLLNSIPVLNTNVFQDAQASDERRATTRGSIRSPLEGVPVTIKDSYKIKGMTVAAGSHAFQDLIATDDSFVVSQIKNGGGIIMGRTNMPPMAAGGMQRGVYGRAESPYNGEYLTAAFASGSSNGSATATAASFGVVGMGEETISSGRSPASNNALVAYTPSRGLISIRGNWPLFANCDTVVPHTRSVRDMMTLLDLVVAKDDVKQGDFWREQPFVPLPPVEAVRPRSYHDLADPHALAGKTLGVPKMYIGEDDPEALPVHVSPSVRRLWDQARKTLESLGATVQEVDFPIVTNLEKPRPGEAKPTSPSFPPVYREEPFDMVQFLAYTWDDFLRDNNDAAGSGITTLAAVAPETIFPHPPGCLRDRYAADDPLVQYAALVDRVKKRGEGGKPTGGGGSGGSDRWWARQTYAIPHLGAALRSFEQTRAADFEAWLDRHGLDAVVFPANGDVGRADADRDEAAARAAWRNGVLYSNGNCAVRRFGIPTVNVPMGVMAETGMPVNLLFASKAYHDNALFGYAYAFEQARGERGGARVVPGRTPALPTDELPPVPVPAAHQTSSRDGEHAANGATRGPKATVAPGLAATAKRGVVVGSGGGGGDGDDNSGDKIDVSGSVSSEQAGGLKSLEVFVDGVRAADVLLLLGGSSSSTGDEAWTAVVEAKTKWDGRPEEKNVPDPHSAMVVVLAVANNGRAAGELLFV